MRTKILSHYDLDGIGAVINIWNSLRPDDYFEYKLTGYGPLEKNIKTLSRDNVTDIWITDLNFKEEHIKLLTFIKNSVRVNYIDHHTYDYSVEEAFTEIPNSRTRIDQRYCGSLNTFLFLSNLTKNKPSPWNKNKEKLVELNKIIDAYDRWQLKSSYFTPGIGLNDLFWEYGFEKFFKKFRNGYNLDEEDVELIEKKSIERKISLDDSYNNHSMKCFETKSLFVFNTSQSFINDFTIFYPDFTFYVLLKEFDKDTTQFSVRVKSDTFDLMDIFAKLKADGLECDCGGHAKAGGITVKKEDVDKFIENINEIFGELINGTG